MAMEIRVAICESKVAMEVRVAICENMKWVYGYKGDNRSQGCHMRNYEMGLLK